MKTAMNFGATMTLILALAIPSLAQEGSTPPEGGKVLGTVVEGNKIIEFRAADTSDLDLKTLRTWEEFAASHPDIEHQLAYKPKLIDDSKYLAKHPDLAAFFSAHPEVQEAMRENPGNFVAIPPRAGE
jgi:hypothetical protein